MNNEFQELHFQVATIVDSGLNEVKSNSLNLDQKIDLLNKMENSIQELLDLTIKLSLDRKNNVLEFFNLDRLNNNTSKARRLAFKKK